MNQLTFIEKIQVLLKLLFSSPIIIGIFAFSMILMIVLFFYSRINRKIVKYGFCFLYISLIGFAIFKYGKYFLVGIDSFLTLFMANIYFPIIPVYVAIMIISFIIMIFTLGSKSRSRIVKIVNTVFFTIIQMLFALFIYIVESNNIDLSSNTGLYSNEQTMTLLELGMGIFFVWIVILLVLLYLKKADKIFKVKKNDSTDDFDEYINDYNEPTSFNSVVKNDTIDQVAMSPIVDNSSDVFPVVDSEFKPSDEIDNFAFDQSVDVSDIGYEPVNTLDDSMNLVSDNNDVNVFNYDTLDNSPSVSDNNDVSNDYNINFESDGILENSLGTDSEVVESIDFDELNIDNTNNLSSSVFDNFNFLDFEKTRVRKNDDVEVIDFD